MKQPLGKFRIGPVLHFDVQQYPFFRTVEQPDLDQHVDKARAAFGIANNSAQFLVQKLRGARPINGPLNLRKAEPQKGTQVKAQRFFPRTIEFLGHAGTLPKARKRCDLFVIIRSQFDPGEP
jgi:hypothetical protein